MAGRASPAWPPPARGPAAAAGDPATGPRASAVGRRDGRLVLREETALAPQQAAYRAALEALCPEAASARRLAPAWHRLIRARDRAALGGWLATAEAAALPEFRAFASGVRRDSAAVAAAREHEWCNGQVEGQVNTLKLVKRAAFGRAACASLRRRVLRASA